MKVPAATEQSQDSRRQGSLRHQTELDNRYGKIGISAVAAAVRHCEQKPEREEPRSEPYDRD